MRIDRIEKQLKCNLKLTMKAVLQNNSSVVCVFFNLTFFVMVLVVFIFSDIFHYINCCELLFFDFLHYFRYFIVL